MKEFLKDEFKKLKKLISREEKESNEDLSDTFENIDDLISSL